MNGYEEGTWTPLILVRQREFTLSVGRYRKIGRRVKIRLTITIGDK